MAINNNFIKTGEPYSISPCFRRWTHIGLFSFNETGDGGSAAFAWFRYDYDGTKGVE